MPIESVNWGYWQWMKSRGKLHAGRTSTTSHESMISMDVQGMADNLALLESKINDMEEYIEDIEEENSRKSFILSSKIEAMQKGTIATDSTLKDVLQTVIEMHKEIKELKERPAERVTEQIIVNENIFRLKDGHKAVISLLANSQKTLTYKEIAYLTGIPNSSVRVYVAELQKIGFPFEKMEIEGKVLISVADSHQEIEEFVQKYSSL